jgi:diguanylate cyclase (GGDEF)-like protein/PAS domain S-box-containing protein
MEVRLKENEHWYSTLLKSIDDAVITIDMDKLVSFMNPAAEKLTGSRIDEAIGHELESIFQVLDEKENEVPRFADTIIEKKCHVVPTEYTLLSRDDSRHPIEVSAAPLTNDRKEKIGAVLVFRNLSSRKAVEEALRESNERYEIAVQGANDGIWDWNVRTNTVFFSPRWKKMIGCDKDDIETDPEEWFSRVHPSDRERLKSRLLAHIKSPSGHFEEEYRIQHNDGTWVWMLCRGIALRDKYGEAYRMAGSQTDITSRKNFEEQMLHDAFHDALTGLPNRALFMDRLGISIAHTRRRKAYTFAVLFLDLDRFKLINDSFGHITGDQLLIAVARRLESLLRPGDTVARLGGDEFAILLEDIEEMNDATRAAERIQKELALPFNLDEHDIFTTASIGIALSSTGYKHPEDPLRDADTAMYRAKASGRARHEIFDKEMHEIAVGQLKLETELRQAVEREEFCVYYQPIISLDKGTITGFESLLRWHHPDRGIVYPEDFITIAEETGLIVPLGLWVLREACQSMKTWQTSFPAHNNLAVSVNLSAKQFLQPDLIDNVAEILDDTKLDPKTLRIEITESAVMHNAEAAITKLKALKDMHIQIHIDDFGTGYSSLSYLHRFPTDTVKIDRSFVSTMQPDDENCEIVKTIVNLARNLGMNVTAEGLETAAQLAQLRQLQCQYGQGYFFSRAVDGKAAQALIAANPHW